MKALFAGFLLLLPTVGFAADPTPLGNDRYMLSDRAKTIWGSTAKIVANLMEEAQTFCRDKNGKEAVLLDTDGQEAIMGRGATGSIQFRCGSGGSARQTAIDNLDVLAKLKSLLDSGAITQDEFDAQKKRLLSD